MSSLAIDMMKCRMSGYSAGLNVFVVGATPPSRGLPDILKLQMKVPLAN